MLSSVDFGALLTYSPRGKSETSVNSQLVRDGIKGGNDACLRRACDRLQEECMDTPLGEFFGPDVLLVPVPGSAPLRDPASFWGPRWIAQELVRHVGLERPSSHT